MNAATADDPRIVLLSLRIVEAITLDDSDRLNVALADCRGDALPVMLSLAAFATELLRTRPEWEAELQRWMLGSEIEIIGDTPAVPPDVGDGC